MTQITITNRYFALMGIAAIWLTGGSALFFLAQKNLPWALILGVVTALLAIGLP